MIWAITSVLCKSLLLYGVRHKLLFSTLRTNNILPVCYEALANHGALAGRADEAIIMPVSALKRNEPGATNACNRFSTGCTSLREQFAKAISTVGLVIPGGESLSCQRLCAVGAGKTFSVPGIIPVGHTSLGNHLRALDALGSKLIFITFCTIDIMLLGDKGLSSNRTLTGAADKTLLMPLSGLVLHLLHTCPEYIRTSITPGGELGIIARSTVNPVCLAAKLFVDQAAPALVAQETGLMPMLLFVGQVL